MNLKYGINKNLESEHMPMEIDFVRSSVRCLRLEKNINNVIRETISIKSSALDYTRYKQLYWYIHVQRMDKEMLSLKILEWCPPEIEIRGCRRLQ